MHNEMLALQKEITGIGLKLKKVPVPQIKPREVLIKITAAGICGTDLHIYNWDKWSENRIKPPLIAGHEFVGRIVEIGSEVTGIKLGMRVSAEGHIICGHCQFCRTGQGHICQDVQIIGVDRDGCFAEYLAMPFENLWPVPDAIPDNHAAIFDPLGNAMHTVMAFPVAGKSVLVMGAGAIGLFTIPILKAVGASPVIVVEPNAYRRALAKKCNADIVLNPMEDDVKTVIAENTQGLGVEVLLEMSGNEKAIDQAFNCLRNGGGAAMLGIPSNPIQLDLAKHVIFKAADIKGINGRRMYDTWYQCQSFLLRKNIRIDDLITHIFDFKDYETAFKLLNDGKAAKIILTFGE
jgi:threonine 3-dehydrogenase